MAAESDERFREQFGDLVAALLDESHERERDDELANAIRAHLEVDAGELPVHSEDLPTFELANLQVGLDAALARPGYTSRILGLAGQGRAFADVSLGDLLHNSHLRPGPPEYVNAAIGPGQTLPCLTWALLLVTSPDGPLCVFVRRGRDNGPTPGLSVQVISREEAAGPRFLADLLALMEKHDVFRGQLITLEADRRGSRSVIFLERPQLNAGDLVLPDGVLDRIERHVVGPTQHRDSLRERKRHLSRGLLLWGHRAPARPTACAT